MAMSSAASRKDAQPFASVVEVLREIVEPHRLPMVERSLARQMVGMLKQHRRELSSAVPEPLTDAERRALTSVGVEPAAQTTGALPGGAVSFAVLAGTALPLADVATLLDVTTGRLRQRLAEGDLVGVRGDDGRSWRIPLFQFAEGKELPGLKTILRAVAPDVHPVEVASFFTTPQPDLEGDGGIPMTPSDWLRSGGDPKAVATLAKAL